MKMNSESFLLNDETEWQQVGKGVERQIMGYDDQVMLVKVKFEEGAVGDEHSHYHSQTTYVASGQFEFTVDGITKNVKSGDGLYIAPHVLHSTRCIEPGILIDCFSPMREDFITKK
jgi:quercetin dioxygenase-like cupin family protein